MKKILLFAVLAFFVAIEAEIVKSGPFSMRGFGKVFYHGEQHGDISLGFFQCESPEKATITGSKYLADMQNYGAVEKVADMGSTIKVRHGGFWKLGIDGGKVMILHAPDLDALKKAIHNHNGSSWQDVPEKAYPSYLDNFDNAALALWWMSSTKTTKEMQYFKENPIIANLHEQNMSQALAPGVFNNSHIRNAAAQLKTAGKPYRTMLWTGDGKTTWYSWMNMAETHFENYVSGFIGKSLFEAAGYYTNHIATDFLNDLQFNALFQLMELWKDDTDLLAWMHPHGEFQLFLYSKPPMADKNFPEYLREVKKYDLQTLSVAWSGRKDYFKSWNEVKIPDPAYFQGRRDNFIDLDDIEWKWQSASLENGEKSGYYKSDYDDANWYTSFRTNPRLQAFVGRYSHVPGEKVSLSGSLWTRFKHEVPDSFLTDHSKIYLHIMPITERNAKDLAVWVNGREVVRNLIDSDVWYRNEHSEVEVSEYLKAGENEFTIFCHGGRIAYRVFLSPFKGGKYPYVDTGMNRRFLDWRDYLRYEKFLTMEKYLKAMRTIDPVRPIKVMTPNQWQTEAFELFEKYGAYPQLTGETTWYRPMHYKGYTMLRDRFSSSEPGGFVKDAKNGQHMYANVFWESQDCHDYGFDFTRDFWRFPEVVKWWADNRALLKTLAKTNYVRNDLGLLRDVDQGYRYNSGMIWNWDMSRGVLPALGLTPVLVNGLDLERGVADGKVAVMLDCATTVMDDKLVNAVKKYVQNGGVFIAQHHTGQHSPEKRDAWPLPTAFGLKVNTLKQNGTITFSTEQQLFPSLKGKALRGTGASIAHDGNTQSGQVAISGQGNAVARWNDGSMAIAEVPFGKGRFIMIGTPFYLRIKDDGGKWLNEKSRQNMVEEMLASLGIKRDTGVTNPAIWFEKRISKNGVYDVYFAGAMGIKGDKWTLEDRLESDLVAYRGAMVPAVDVTSDGVPDIKTEFKNGRLHFGNQQFSPYQIRQFAIVRDRAGIAGPAYWLKNQHNGWYQIDEVKDDFRTNAMAAVKSYAAKVGEDGLDISAEWFVSLNDTAPGWIRSQPEGWNKANIGSWLEQKFPADTNRVRYKKTVEVPGAWLENPSRIFLCFGAYGEYPHKKGFNDNVRIWINGKSFVSGVPHSFKKELPADMLKNGKFDIAMEITAVPEDGKTGGPVGTFYLHKYPCPVGSIELNGEWTHWENVFKSDRNIMIPYKGRIFGISKKVAIPKEWRGKLIRLVVDETTPTAGIKNIIINNSGYLRESSLASPGIRVDRYLKCGEDNTFDLFGRNITPRAEQFNADITGIRLEAYDLKDDRN